MKTWVIYSKYIFKGIIKNGDFWMLFADRNYIWLIQRWHQTRFGVNTPLHLSNLLIGHNFYSFNFSRMQKLFFTQTFFFVKFDIWFKNWPLRCEIIAWSLGEKMPFHYIIITKLIIKPGKINYFLKKFLVKST